MIAVLSLERSSKRRQLLEEQFNKAGITDYVFFPAFDCKDVINKSIGGNIIYGYGLGRKFQPAELSIIYGHLAIIKHAQAMDYENIIVLEDDVVICDDWKDRIDVILSQLPENWEYLYLSGHSDYVKLDIVDKLTISPAPKMIGAYSYIVNKSAYSKICSYCSSMITTYDDMIMSMIVKGKLNAYLVQPFLTYHNAEESLI
jgi:GR25 family glycosyltransferase involved in LPS biosynthesis